MTLYSFGNIILIGFPHTDLQKNLESVLTITIRNEAVAEIRSAKPQLMPGEAVRKLI